MLNLSKEKLLIIIALSLAGVSLTASIVLGLQVIKLKRDLTHQPFPTLSPVTSIVPQLSPAPTISSEPDQETLQVVRCKGEKIENEYLLVLQPIPDASHCEDLDWEQRGKCVFEYLQELSEKAQKEIIEHLNANSVNYETFYINNSILLKNIDERQLQLIYNQFKDKIEHIRERCLVHIMD